MNYNYNFIYFYYYLFIKFLEVTEILMLKIIIKNNILCLKLYCYFLHVLILKIMPKMYSF